MSVWIDNTTDISLNIQVWATGLISSKKYSTNRFSPVSLTHCFVGASACFRDEVSLLFSEHSVFMRFLSWTLLEVQSTVSFSVCLTVISADIMLSCCLRNTALEFIDIKSKFILYCTKVNPTCISYNRTCTYNIHILIRPCPYAHSNIAAYG